MEGILALGIPIIIFMIPIVAILTSHQQKMAKIIHSNKSGVELEALKAEVQELKALVHQQTLQIDYLNNVRQLYVSAVENQNTIQQRVHPE